MPGRRRSRRLPSCANSTIAAGFREGYAEELEASEGAAAFAERCRKWLETQDVTLLYAAKNQQENHAQVLAAWLRQKSGAEGGA